MFDLTRSARTWLTLQEQAYTYFSCKVNHVRAALIRSTMFGLILQSQPCTCWSCKANDVRAGFCKVNHARVALVRSTINVHTWLSLKDQHVHGWPYKIRTYMVDPTRSARKWSTLQNQHDKVGLTRLARIWLTLQDQHVHGWPYKTSTYMVDLTRSARGWLTLQDQHIHGWPYNISTYMHPCSFWSCKVNHVRADLVRSTMYVLVL
jgi:hypothetical protein